MEAEEITSAAAMEAGISDHVWTFEELAALADQN
jgi:hypothetical protein